MFFKNIFDYFTAKKIENYVRKTERSFLLFYPVVFNEKYEKKANKIDKNKYEKLILLFKNTKEKIEKHNLKIKELETEFLEIIKENPYKKILENIDLYSEDQIKEFNETALKIGEYSLPDAYENKTEFLEYSVQLGLLVENFSAVNRQFSLIKNFENYLKDFKDEYIDGEKKEQYVFTVNQKLEEIKTCGNYYSIPSFSEKFFDELNERFIERHLSDEIFDDVSGKSLDEDQRRAVLCDSFSNLVVAGAGAGKTLTILGKVKYLLRNGFCRPQDILLMSYSSASAQDLERKIKTVSQDVTVKTFHSLGLNILNNSYGKKRAVEEQFPVYVQRFFEEKIYTDVKLQREILDFFGVFLYSDKIEEKRYKDKGEEYKELNDANFVTLQDKIKKLSNREEKQTFHKEYVKSYEELSIANFLYLNGVKYEYERVYEYDTATIKKRQYTPDFYLTDYGIYYEHYGIDEHGKTPQYGEDEEREYLEGMAWKRKTHEEHQTTCIETYSYEFSNGTVFDKLKERLEKNGVKLTPLSDEEMKEKLALVLDGIELNSLMNLFSTFISLYKSQYEDETGFDGLLEKIKNENSYYKMRTERFLSIAKKIYLFYRTEIKNQNKIDFDDMILSSMKEIEKTEDYKYKYVIVDEFQDISQSRMRFLKTLINHGHSKVFAVGDDWQAIYRFAGCDISIFLKFDNYFKDVKINYINATHRNSQELQNIVEPFITANPEQFVKHIRSEKHQNNPVRIIYHNGKKYDAFNRVLREINKENSQAKVLVLGRNKHDVDEIDNGEIEVVGYRKITHEKYPEMEITYKTVHGSKGLENDYVILISGEKAVNGFPNKMEDDPVLRLVLSEKSNFEFAEERRLFYVALTRTKSVVYVLSNYYKKSEFVEEIEERVKIEKFDIETENKKAERTCPWCKSGKLVLRETKENRQFYGCSYFPRCKYTNGNVIDVKRNNRCPKCGDYLIVRNGRRGKFLACYNREKCGYCTDLPIDFYDRKKMN